ncbi:MAG: DNA-binding response regulator, partial [Acidimicrobiia bacterium]
MRTALEDAGFSVVEAPDGPSAVAALHGCHPDVVLLDVALPGLDGFGVLRALRQQGLARGARV